MHVAVIVAAKVVDTLIFRKIVVQQFQRRILRLQRIQQLVKLEQQLVRVGLERLGGKCKDLLEALFGAGGEPNYTLIAEKLGIRVGSIGPTRARCLEKLSAILGRLGFGDGPKPGADAEVDEETE